MANEKQDGRKAEAPPTLTSPTGPHEGQVDEAAGGADSSPLEDVPSGEQQRRAQERRKEG